MYCKRLLKYKITYYGIGIRQTKGKDVGVDFLD